MSHDCQRFWNCYKPSRFTHFWQGAESLAHATQNHVLTFKSGPRLSVFLHFSLPNVLSTSQLPKVLWACCALYVLTSECASRHNGVHFFDISTSKSGSMLVCFVHFDFKVCFAPQRRALFQRLNFQKWSEYILTWKFASRQNGVQFFISHLARWLRTRRFSEPTFRPSGATNHWKNTVFRDFATFSRTCIFCLLTRSFLWSSFFFSSLLWLFPPLLFHVSIYCRKFDF